MVVVASAVTLAAVAVFIWCRAPCWAQSTMTAMATHAAANDGGTSDITESVALLGASVAIISSSIIIFLLASGVGFIGAGVISTTTPVQQQQPTVAGGGNSHSNGSTLKKQQQQQLVHGLTTAAAIWLSAAVGVASGVGLYVIAGTTAAMTIGILRLGKMKQTQRQRRQGRTTFQNEHDDDYHHHHHPTIITTTTTNTLNVTDVPGTTIVHPVGIGQEESEADAEKSFFLTMVRHK